MLEDVGSLASNRQQAAAEWARFLYENKWSRQMTGSLSIQAREPKASRRIMWPEPLR